MRENRGRELVRRRGGFYCKTLCIQIRNGENLSVSLLNVRVAVYIYIYTQSWINTLRPGNLLRDVIDVAFMSGMRPPIFHECGLLKTTTNGFILFVLLRRTPQFGFDYEYCDC